MLILSVKRLVDDAHCFAEYSVHEELQVTGPQESTKMVESSFKRSKSVRYKPGWVSKYVCEDI